MANRQVIDRVGLLCLHTSPLAAPGGPDAGGMNLYITRLADELNSCGVQTDIFTRRHDERTPAIVQRSSGSRIIHLAGGPAHPVAKRVLPLYIPAMVQSFHDFVEQERVQYDILHSHYWLSGLTAMRIRHDPRVPVIHMFHTLAKVKEKYLRQGDSRDSALRIDGELCLIGSADVIVGATAAEEQLMQELYGRVPTRYEVIPPGVDLDLFRPHNQLESRTKLGVKGERIVLFVGRLDRIKGLDTLIQAVAHLKHRTEESVRLVVVGGFDGVHGRPPARYRQAVARSGLADDIEFRGMVPQEDLPHYYSAADVCAMPSAYESFGMVAVESMACQTPVVAFAVGGLECTIKDGKTGFLAEPGNPASFEFALLRALCHPDLSTVGRQARFSVRHHDWSSIVDKTLSLYEQSAASRAYSGSRVAGNC